MADSWNESSDRWMRAERLLLKLREEEEGGGERGGRGGSRGLVCSVLAPNSIASTTFDFPSIPVGNISLPATDGMWNLRRRTRTRTAQLYVWFVVVAALWFVVQSSMMHQISLVQENRPKAVGGKHNFYDDAKGSERTLLHAALSPRPVFDEAINEDEERARCKRYNLQYSGSRKERRRIFAGSLIADDSWHAISGVALETYGEIVFVDVVIL
eukprot:scaffold1201_cov199-Alexandrium_tamarense.AAC.25